ncbi:MAG TPA: hypothetical protein VMD79_14045 [Solirubrobacteraceae bacterium]|nr:hypothetical protein [Solirubrobacteraceae bacterium]
MTDRLACLELIDSYLSDARLAHWYAFRLHRALVGMVADDDHTRGLLRESAALALVRAPGLAQSLRGLEREWGAQDLLDPPAASHTAKRLESHVAGLVPEFEALSERHEQIVAELLDLVNGAR